MSLRHFEEFSTQESTTADQIKMRIGDITHSLGNSWIFFYAGLSLMVLGVGCYLFGRPSPVTPSSEKA